MRAQADTSARRERTLSEILFYASDSVIMCGFLYHSDEHFFGSSAICESVLWSIA